MQWLLMDETAIFSRMVQVHRASRDVGSYWTVMEAVKGFVFEQRGLMHRRVESPELRKDFNWHSDKNRSAALSATIDCIEQWPTTGYCGLTKVNY